MQKIQFFFHDRKPALKKRKRLRVVVEDIFIKEKKKLQQITYIYCSDSYLLDINKKFLNHNFYTDIITFDLSPTEFEIVGEVYISIDRVKENAKTNHTKFNEELCRVIFHGALHLCGYMDKKKKEIVVMRSKEEKYLKMYFGQTKPNLFHVKR
jgi:probable rRNA maturation factor